MIADIIKATYENIHIAKIDIYEIQMVAHKSVGMGDELLINGWFTFAGFLFANGKYVVDFDPTIKHLRVFKWYNDSTGNKILTNKFHCKLQ